ncbi:hypothetical protein GT037_006010 [Alternaria burnsii]|uniref:Uncharacterized protein n=1 Tax=Alternaria burnsii TaxID=1187904 RepID=A0A8H7EFK7_9PLEO|nr:uncharacterized protein GT037_006010 [Alternaria burnsii]KAF7676505.1 hypothetical protein GT037_006010 [Alternaria burnsii]
MNVRKSGTPATVVLVKNISEVAPFDRYHRTHAGKRVCSPKWCRGPRCDKVAYGGECMQSLSNWEE